MTENMNGPGSAELEMRFDLNVLQHLGLKMYTSLPAVISEYVANAWDAWAENVEISIPKQRMSPDYEITISDDGQGMTFEEVNNKFLVVGRNKRQDEDRDFEEKDGERRMVMGRKGIGKLAGFGIADVVRIRTTKDGQYIEFELDYGEMRKEANEDPNATTTYNPRIVDRGRTSNESGTVVTLTQFDREQRPTPRYARQRLARRFSVIGDNFTVRVNGKEVTGEERNLKSKCQFLREYDQEPIDSNGKYTISGWIGTLPKPVPDEIHGGVAVMARGKTAQKPISFGAAEGGTGGQFALQYLVGEIHADFLDEKEDLIATHRNEVMWERRPADKLFNHIQNEILEFCSEWPGKRRVEKMEKIRDEEPYERFIQPLDEHERNLADKFLGKLAERSGYDDEILEEMASYVSTGVQQKSFSNLMREIEQSNVTDTERLVDLFDRYEVLDAMNSLRIVKGRYRAIQKFEDLIETEESDIGDLHGFVSDNPWLIDPRWDYLDEELSIRTEINKNFENTDAKERVGFICLGDADTVRLVDVRKPNYILNELDLTNFKRYVDFLRSLGNMEPMNDRDVEGYIIAKGALEERDVQAEIRRMKMDDMRIRSYKNIKDIARRSHQEFLRVFERKAERTQSEMLRSHLGLEGQTGITDFGIE